MSEMRIKCRYDALVAVDSLRPFPKNRNQHTDEQIARLALLLKYQGVRAPIVVATAPYDCIAKGHGTLDAIRFNGWKDAPVVYQDFDDEDQLYAFVQSDNAIAAWAELDLSGINADVGDLGPDFDIDLLGIKDFTLDVSEKLGDPDEVPEPPKEAKTKRGELWILGEHRVLCGDATSQDDVARLMAGERADMVFTDPPYGVAVENTRGSIAGDLDLEVFKKSLPLLREAAAGDAHFYVWCASGDRLPESIWEFAKHIPFQNLLPVRCTHENKRGPKGAFKYNYEVCLFGNDNSRGFESSDKIAVSETTLKDDRYKGDGFLKVYPALWDGNRATEHNINIVHPTQKKVEMIEFYVGVSSKPRALVLDLFWGSGSTLIACEKTSRRCYGMELEPLYVDVILTRWAKYTGRDPVREDGVKWSELQGAQN